MQIGPTEIIHGDCRGADRMAGEVAELLGIQVHKVPADWDTYGNKAGPIRNSIMLGYMPKMVIAFHNDIENSKGTKDMVTKAKNAGIDVRIISTPVTVWP